MRHAWVIFFFSLTSSVALTGCSTFYPDKDVVLPSASVGESGTLRVGVASRAEVIALFGEPGYRSKDDREFGYLFAPEIGTQKGLLVGPCSQMKFGQERVSAMDDLWLAFDKDGVLLRYEKQLVKRHDGDDEEAWQAFQKHPAS